MDKFHMYGAIGRGKHSTVYKGRMKKSIEYFAIKSVEKSQKTKILREVRNICPCVVDLGILRGRGYDEFVKTGDPSELQAVASVLHTTFTDVISLYIGKDGQLPEDSVHDIASDLVRALQYIHSQGVIYCDLKPSNILFDENGHAKLCDFGLARILTGISGATSTVPNTKRGTPSYMAPELFEDGGVHSYASDFWALGCVLYECYTGRPPFLGREFTQLVKSILSDSTPALPGNPSRPFVNLINSLLIKDPAERIKWSELCVHAFWRTKFDSIPLPPQPAFDIMIELYTKPCLSDCNGERPTRNKTPPKHSAHDTRGPSRHDENSNVGSKGYTTPTKTALSARKIQTKTSAKVVEDKQKDSSRPARGVNLLRLSRIAKSNLQRENDKENYRRPLPSGPENDAEVKIENTDMELDFNENDEDEVQEEQDGSDTPSSTPAEKSLNDNQEQGKVEEMDADMQVDSPAPNVPDSDEPSALNQEAASDVSEAPTLLPSASPQLKAPISKESEISSHGSDSSNSPGNLADVLWHPTDLSIRPVMPSRKADRAEIIPSLPFEAPQAPDFVKMTKGHLDTFTNKIVAIFSGNTNTGEKQNVLRYLEALSANADAANILTNGPIMLMLVKMLRQSKIHVLRVQLASLIGLLIRHSTYIDDDLANSGIIGSLTNGLRDGQEKVRRFCMAALGELLFYISTQSEQNRENLPECATKDNRSASGWQVPNSLISLVSSVLRKGEDDMTQLYALRTIENVSSQGAHWATRFTSQDVIGNLCYIYRASGKQESIRLTAGSCLVRLVRFSLPSIQWVIEKLSFKEITISLVKGSPREQQISLNLLNMAMLASQTFSNMGRHLVQLLEDRNLVPCLISLTEQGTEVLRGKALVLVALLCKNGKKWLPHFFSSTRLISALDRLAKEKDYYIKQCLTASAHAVASIVPTLLENVVGDVQQMMGGKRHGMSPLSGRNTAKTNAQLFPVVLNLLHSPTFKHRVATLQVRQQLAKIIKLVENPFQGRDDIQLPLLRVVESITEESSWILESSDIFIHNILPSLANLYKGNKDGDARFLCLKILFDVMLVFLNECPDLDQKLDDLKSISNKHFLPLYPTLIEDEDPIPMYAQKLLLMLIEFNCIRIPDILQPKTISKCFDFLLGDLSKTNVNDVKICLALVSDSEMDSKLLSQLKVVRRVGKLLEFVHAKDMEDFLEPTLELCRAFLQRSVGSKNGDILSETSSGNQVIIRDIADFSGDMGVFLDLCRVPEGNIADMASECVGFLLKAAPREGTAGFLTNLSKVSAVLDVWNKGMMSQVQRIVQALGYSCRQYSLHAMILSISVSEVLKIDGILSAVKNSSTTALANAAKNAASELQRLPRS